MTAIMLFAARFGTRMGALTRDRPKPMIPVAGRPLIDHTLDLARATNPDRIVANLHYKPDMLRDHLTPQGVLLSHEQTILDTGGGLKAALPLLNSNPVVTMNADVIWRGPNPIDLLNRHWYPARMDGLMVCVPLAQTVGRKGGGDLSLDAQGHVGWGGDLVFGGVQMLNTDGLAQIHEAAFSLHALWAQMLAAGRLHGVRYPGRWCDVGHPEGIKPAEDLLTDV